jgi:hypothetical protein
LQNGGSIQRCLPNHMGNHKTALRARWAGCLRSGRHRSIALSHGLLTVQGGVLAVDRFGCACGCLPPMHPMKKREKKKGSPQRHIGTETRVERDRLALLGAN